MKTKLTMIGLAMALGAWMAIANSPTVRSLEQRVSELEQMVGQLNQVVVSQQQEIERFAPLAHEMEVITWSDGSKSIRFIEADLWVKGQMSQVEDLVVVGNLYHYGSIVQLP